MNTLKVWFLSVLSHFFCPDNILGNIFTIIGIIIALKGVTIALDVYEDFKQRQTNAVWSFYSNLSALLRSLKLSIGENSDVPAKAMEYFYTEIPQNDCLELLEVKYLQKLANDFLYYLYTAKDQVPPVKNFDEWKEKRIILIDFLNDLLFLGARSFWQSKKEVEEKHRKILSIIKYMEDEIDNVVKSQFNLNEQ